MRLQEIFESWGPEQRPGVLPIGDYLSSDSEFVDPTGKRDPIELHQEVDDILNAGGEPRVVRIKPSQVYATQDWLSNGGGDGPLYPEYEDLPVVYQKGRYPSYAWYVLDGHHRITAALKKHQPIDVYMFGDYQLDQLKEMRAQKSTPRMATGQQVLDYVNKTHHEPLVPDLEQAVLRHPRWKLTTVRLSDLNIPDQSYDDDEDYEPPEDPYGRVMDVDSEHAGEYSANAVDRLPIVVDAQGFIIDGNHRAWAAAELLNRDSIKAWVPAEVKENTDHGNRRTAELLVRELEVELADYYDASRGTAPAQYKDQVRRRISALNQELQGLGFKYAPTAPGKIAPLGSRFVENFADKKVKGKSRPGRVKRAGASCKGSVTDLRAKARKYGGERGKMYHWCANMKGGKKK